MSEHAGTACLPWSGSPNSPRVWDTLGIHCHCTLDGVCLQASGLARGTRCSIQPER